MKFLVRWVRTALVFSAGGMFGAYQAGAWKVLAGHLQPDLIVGASIGAVNGWAVAGGCSPELLIRTWLDLGPLARYQWRVPRSLTRGFIDPAPINAIIERLHSQFRPRIEYGAVLTDSLRLRPVVFRGPDVTWRHLAASAAILGFFDQQRIDGRHYSDGGLLDALPLWAAAQMGAERIVAVNALVSLPAPFIRALVGGLRKVRRFRPKISESIEVVRIQPTGCLGTAKESLYWTRANTEKWIREGERDALAALDRLR